MHGRAPRADLRRRLPRRHGGAELLADPFFDEVDAEAIDLGAADGEIVQGERRADLGPGGVIGRPLPDDRGGPRGQRRPGNRDDLLHPLHESELPSDHGWLPNVARWRLGSHPRHFIPICRSMRRSLSIFTIHGQGARLAAAFTIRRIRAGAAMTPSL